MTTLNSPGVSVTITDESQYASAGTGTTPCIFIATAANKASPTGSGIAPGTQSADQLYLVTSQREAIQTFGNPTFYSSNGTSLDGYELNEYGLHALYQYLGIANSAYVVRADIDLNQLAPSITAPVGPPLGGTYWLDLTNTSWGVFQSNGNNNPGLAWASQTVTVIDTPAKADMVLYGSCPVIVSSYANQPVITSAGNLIINGTTIPCSVNDTLLSVMTKINSAQITNITASLTADAAIVAGSGSGSSSNVAGVAYNLKIVNTAAQTITVTGDDPVLTQLGLITLSAVYEPASSIGTEGNFAIVTFINNNQLYQRITPRDCTGTAVSSPNVGGQWYLVGSPTWKSATPTVIKSNPVTVPFKAGYIDIASSTGNQRITVNAGDGVTQVAGYINNTAGLISNGIVAQAIGNQLFITNINGLDIQIIDDNNGILANMGLTATVYPGNRLNFSTHTQVPTNSVLGDVWIKTTSPNKGANWVVKLYNATVGQWIIQNAPLYDNNTDASTALGSTIASGTLYVQYNVNGNGTANFMIYSWTGSTWTPLTSVAGSPAYEASLTAPTSSPANGTYWYNNNFQVDLMVSNGNQWFGYRNMYPSTDIILDASQPSTKLNGLPLIENDIWINTSNLEQYPQIYRYFGGAWTLVDNTDNTSPFGIVFSDARQDDGNGNTDYTDMLISNYTDLDAPNPLLYPDGLILFNTRYSTYNVKQWTVNYMYEGQVVGNRWVTVSGNYDSGPNANSPYMGRKAQRRMIVQALSAVIQNNLDLRNDSVYFNLIATPGYVECLSDMVTLNTDKSDFAFIIGDTPPRLAPDSTSLQNWATNAAVAATDGEDGLTTHNSYIALYYPWGYSTNIDGSNIMIPPSTISLLTYAYSDSVSYPWYAPAGYNRGLVNNATTTGYLLNGVFKTTILNQGQRDVLYENSINPIAFIQGRGLVVWGQKTLDPVSESMDRVNVARLTNYLRRQLDLLAKPFLFEQNDTQTQTSVAIIFNRFLSDLVSLQALYDFAVVCDSTNNTPTTIDQNQLWIDIAIQPVKTIEFIFIPVRILSTGVSLS